MAKMSEERKQKLVFHSSPSLYFYSFFKAACSQQGHRIKEFKNKKVLRDGDIGSHPTAFFEKPKPREVK